MDRPAAPAKKAGPETAAAPAAPATDEKDPAYKRSHFGLWCLDLFENMVQPAREAASIERFDAIGSAFHKHIGGQFAVTFAAFPLGTDEKVLVEGVDRRVFTVEDLLLFFKTSEGFLDPKEELKVVRKRFGALFVILKVSLRLSRSGLLGFTLDAQVPQEALKPFALLFREDPLPTPAAEFQRLAAELKRRDLKGITLIPQSDLISQGHMTPGARVLLTVMKKGAALIKDRKDLETYGASYARVGGPAITSDLVSNVDLALPAEHREVVKQAIIGGLTVPELFAWRDSLEKMGEELAAQTLKETDPSRRAGLEGKLKALPNLLKTVVAKIPPEELEREAAARREKFAAKQDAKADEQTAQRSKEAAAVLEADSKTFIAKLAAMTDKDLYPREVRQACDAYARFIAENLPLATSLMQVLLQHRTDATLPWRREAATAALKELASERMLNRFFDLLKSPAAPERELGRLSLAGVGEPAVARVWEALGTAEDPTLLISVLKDIGAAGEPAVAAALHAGAASVPLPLMHAGLELIATVKRPERFDFVAAYTKHPDSGVREHAFRALVAVDPVKAQPVVKRYIGDRDVVVASTCLLLMGELRTNDPHVVRQMLETIKRREKDQHEPDERLQAASAKALGKLGNFKYGEQTLEELLVSLVKPKEKKLFGGDKLKDKTEAVRAAVCEALGAMGGDAAQQVLRVLAVDEKDAEGVRNAARDALRAMAHRAKGATPAR